MGGLEGWKGACACVLCFVLCLLKSFPCIEEDQLGVVLFGYLEWLKEMKADLACYLFSTEALGLASFLYMGGSVRLHGSLGLASFLLSWEGWWFWFCSMGGGI